VTKRTNLLILIFLVAVVTCSCAAPKMYHWGDYSNSLYNSKKNPSDENLLKHKQVLEEIVEQSNEKSLRVPPGVYAELGYIYFRQNNGKEAERYFELEKQLYPESTVFMQRLIQSIEARKSNDSPKEVGDQKK